MITSKDNNKIKYLRKLMNPKYMKEEKKFIVEGNHLVKEAYKNDLLIETYSLDETDFDCDNYLVTENVLKSVSTYKSVPSIIGVCSFTKEKEELGNKIIILDNVQDPGNVGTIIRSACAFGFDSVVLSLDSVYKYNDKLIKASQGMLFNINVVNCDINSLIDDLKKNQYDIYGTNVNDGIDVKSIERPLKLAVIMGNEGTGISNNIKNKLDKNIYIKTSVDCESLNVSVAASIIMYELGGK